MRLPIALAAGVLMLIAVPSATSAAIYYVDQNHARASDANPGTEARPWATLAAACAKAQAGDTVYVKPGVYREYLAPHHSGTPGAPLTFQAVGDVVVKGSDVVSDWTREGDDWVKRPWREHRWWSENLRNLSEDRFKASTRQEQVFVNGRRMTWVPDAATLEPWSFYWPADASEIRLRLPEEVDLNRALVEVPVRDATLCAWPGVDVRSLRDYDRMKQEKPESVAKLRRIDHLIVRGFTFAHNAALINRGGVRIQGEHWLLEDNIIEWMNSVGVMDGGRHIVLRRNLARFNGQTGFGGSGDDVLYEDNTSLWNNTGEFRTGWGGASDKWGHTNKNIVRRHVTLGAPGSGIWFDIDCVDTVIEDCVVLPNHHGSPGGAHGGIFYEISYDAQIRNNVVFGVSMGTGRTAYGSGVTISSSADCLVEDNVLIFCQNGLGIVGGRRNPGTAGRLLEQYGQGDAYHAMRNRFRNNLTVYPRSTDIYLSADDSTTRERDNRFLDNISLTLPDQVTTQFGKQQFPTAVEMDAAHPLSSGQVVVHEPAALDAASKERIDWAAGRLLHAVDRIVSLNLDTAATTSVQGMWQFPGRRSQAMWIQHGEQHLLLIDAAADEALSVNIGDGAQPQMWSSREPQWQALSAAQPVLSLPVRQGLVVVRGLGMDAQPAGGGVEVWAEQNGQRVTRLAEGTPFRWVVRVTNHESRAVTVSLEGAGLAVHQQDIEPGRTRTFQSPTQQPVAGDAEARIRFQIDGNAPMQLTARASTLAPVIAAAVPSNYFGTDEMLYSSPPPVVIDQKDQMVPELYDLATGFGWNGRDDLSATARIGWNPQGLWTYVDVRDDQVIPAPAERASFDGDAIELFLDGRTSERGQSAYGAGVVQLFVRAPAAETADWTELQIEGGYVTEGMKAKGRVVEAGYQVEVFVPWSAFPDGDAMARAGRVIGFDLAIDDGDDRSGRTGRRTQLVWKGSGQNFSDASGFGLIQLD